MNIQQFLDSERVQFSGSTFYTTTQVREWLKDHDTRLINKVLDEVKREVEKEMKGNEESRIFYKDVLASQSYINGYGNACEDISNLIDQLKLK